MLAVRDLDVVVFGGLLFVLFIVLLACLCMLTQLSPYEFVKQLGITSKLDNSLKRQGNKKTCCVIVIYMTV